MRNSPSVSGRPKAAPTTRFSLDGANEPRSALAAGSVWILDASIGRSQLWVEASTGPVHAEVTGPIPPFELTADGVFWLEGSGLYSGDVCLQDRRAHRAR